MKLALILLSCLVAVSHQQRFIWMPVPAYSPRLNYMAVYLDQQDNPLAESAPLNAQADEDQYLDVVSRSKPQLRFFTNLLLPGLNLAPTVTSTVIATVSSTLTTAVVSSCLPVALFSVAGVAPAAQTTMTMACVRRRRSVSLPVIEDLNPSPTQPEVALSSKMAALRDSRSANGHAHLEPSIEAPSEITEIPGRLLTRGRQNRLFNLPLTVTSTVTVTNFSFAETVVKKTVNLAPANQLQCLPAGFIIC